MRSVRIRMFGVPMLASGVGAQADQAILFGFRPAEINVDEEFE